jgi:ubiquinone/menaquinone biosynthesis C-methylase UbiE
LERALGYIRTLNRCLLYVRQTLSHLQRFARDWDRGRPIRIIDVATGSCDIPIAIVRWSLKTGFDVQVTAIDLHERTVESAAKLVAGAEVAVRDRIRVCRADALKLPFENGAFDYAICSLFLHHLEDAEAVAAMREMDRVAASGLIVCDLLRHYRAYAWIHVLTLLAGPMARHDARVSVAGAFSKEEVLQMREAAGVGYARYFRHFGHRFALAGEKDRVDRAVP